METEQIITKAVAEATRVAIQAMAEAQVEQMHDTSGPKIHGPTVNNLHFIRMLRINIVS